jgi:phage gpG-like protein
MGINSNANEVMARLATRLEGARDRVMDAAEAKFQEGLARTASWIQQNELSGQVLKQRTGRLSQSVGHPTVTRSGYVLNGFMGGVWYGRIHEYGGTFPATSRRGNPYSITFPERAWLRPGIQANKDMIRDLLLEGIRSAL